MLLSLLPKLLTKFRSGHTVVTNSGSAVSLYQQIWIFKIGPISVYMDNISAQKRKLTVSILIHPFSADKLGSRFSIVNLQ